MAPSKTIIIGSRGSELAKWQANFVKEKLEKSGKKVAIKIIKTQGDKIQNLSFDKLEGKGFFTKELEDALLNDTIDIAVHSCKDLPTQNPDGLTIAAFSYREDPSDLLIINKQAVDEKQKWKLKLNAQVGTSSARRKAQLLQFRPDLKLSDLRGNVPTRIKKLTENQYDAIMLAAAGIERLELDLNDFTVVKLSPKEFVPAPAQGVLALQTKQNKRTLIKLLQEVFNYPDVTETTTIERTILHRFNGGCQIPLGVYCEKETDDNDDPYFNIWISYAKSWNAPVSSFYYKTSKPEKIFDKIIANKTIKPTEIFITQNKRAEDYFYRTLTNLGFKVHAQSLIEFRLIPFTKIDDYEWIFFSSKHAVKYFFLQKPQLPKDVKFGVIGINTGLELRRYGYAPDFIGQSTNINSVARQFSNLAGNKKVLFPHAKGSLKSIQQLMPKKDKIINLTVYETIKYPDAKIIEAPIVIFTSPSNVEAYFEKAKFNSDKQIAIAMGDSTERELQKHGIKAAGKPSSFDDLGLVRAVLSL
jgi:hydroxymethylbilane synthase